MKEKAYRPTKKMLELRPKIIEKIFRDHYNDIMTEEFSGWKVDIMIEEIFSDFGYEYGKDYSFKDRDAIRFMVRDERKRRKKGEALMSKIWAFTKAQES